MRKPTFWFPIWSDTNQAVQLQKMARGLKFRIYVVEEVHYPCSESKALISFAVTAKLICVFVFAYAICWFSHDAAHMYFQHPDITATKEYKFIEENMRLLIMRKHVFRLFDQVESNQPAQLQREARYLTFQI